MFMNQGNISQKNMNQHIINQHIINQHNENVRKSKTRRIIDCFIFYNEFDMINYRLNVLNDIVDFFVIVESTHTFSGREKKIYSDELTELFDKFKDKIDLFGGVLGSKRLGKGPYDGKEEALKDYRFSLVIENDKYDTYYTEKLTDAFASGTIPIYWGTAEIGNYFNTDGMIILTPDFDVDILTEDLYNSKLDAVRDNFERVQNLLSADDMLYKQINEN